MPYASVRHATGASRCASGRSSIWPSARCSTLLWQHLSSRWPTVASTSSAAALRGKLKPYLCHMSGVLISKRSQIFDGVIFQVKLASKDIIKEYDQCKALSLAKDARRCHDTEC